jgi:hypothetical protein
MSLAIGAWFRIVFLTITRMSPMHQPRASRAHADTSSISLWASCMAGRPTSLAAGSGR